MSQNEKKKVGRGRAVSTAVASRVIAWLRIQAYINDKEKGLWISALVAHFHSLSHESLRPRNLLSVTDSSDFEWLDHHKNVPCFEVCSCTWNWMIPGGLKPTKEWLVLVLVLAVTVEFHSVQHDCNRVIWKFEFEFDSCSISNKVYKVTSLYHERNFCRLPFLHHFTAFVC